jgi:hypothetical protein
VHGSALLPEPEQQAARSARIVGIVLDDRARTDHRVHLDRRDHSICASHLTNRVRQVEHLLASRRTYLVEHQHNSRYRAGTTFGLAITDYRGYRRSRSMLRALQIVVVMATGCVSGRSEPGPMDEAPPHPPDQRYVTSVVVADGMVAWSELAGPCSLHGPADCHVLDPSVVIADVDSGHVTASISTLVGAQTIVGDEHELFVIVVEEVMRGRSLARLRPHTGAGLEVWAHAAWLPAVAVDTSSVYWFEGDSGPTRVRRASRAGDGLDATTLADDVMYPKDAVVAGGYLWWLSEQAYPPSLYRIPTAGGEPEVVHPFALGVLAADADGVVFVTFAYEIVRLGSSGIETLVANIDQIPYSIVVSEGDVFWAHEGDGRVHRAQVGDAQGSQVPGAIGRFGVTADAILVNFSRHGFTALPR